MNFLRKAGLPAILTLTVLWLGCGDVYRPVANPILKPGGDPAAFRYVVAINNNDGGLGSTSHIDLSGDTNLGNFPVGNGPVYAAFGAGQTQIFIADEAGDTLSWYNAPQCFSGTCVGASAGTPANTIALPAGSRPVFVTTGISARAYVASAGTNSVSVVSTGTSSLIANVPVGPNPTALVLSHDSSKLYVINKGNGAANGTVSVLATTDNAELHAPITVGRLPVAAALSPDGSTLYVLNQGSGTVSVINTVVDALVGTPVPVGSVPTQLFVDQHFNRLYVTNSGSNNVTVFDISAGVPASRKTVQAGTTPVSITVLGNGSRAYVANAGSNDVTVIDTTSFTVKTTIAVGEHPIYIASSAGDPTRVFVANYGPPSAAVCTTGVALDPAHPECYGFISDINTNTDTVVAATTTSGTPATVPPGTTLPSGAPRPVFLLPTA